MSKMDLTDEILAAWVKTARAIEQLAQKRLDELNEQADRSVKDSATRDQFWLWCYKAALQEGYVKEARAMADAYEAARKIIKEEAQRNGTEEVEIKVDQVPF